MLYMYFNLYQCFSKGQRKSQLFDVKFYHENKIILRSLDAAAEREMPHSQIKDYHMAPKGRET